MSEAPQVTPNIAVFCDFENIAIGARDAKLESIDIHMMIERVLEKGRVLIKRAYADWQRYKTNRKAMHEEGFELIEIPHVSYSGKNSADIYLVVEALDLCYTRPHIDTFVIMSGDSDFSPLVRKLRENNKRVIGLGVKNSSSNLLIENCDEFIYYDDIARRRSAKKSSQPAREKARTAERAKEPVPAGEPKDAKEAPGDLNEALDLILDTVEALLTDRDDVNGSVVKQTIRRKKPNFDESYYGYRTFTALLEEAQKRRLLVLQEDPKAGGYLIVGFGEEA